MKSKKITRRIFLNSSLCAGAFSFLTGKIAGQSSMRATSETGHVYSEPKKELPIYGKFDVIVVGGGPGGFAAALASARNGARTLIIERFPYFGGTATASLMPNINGYRNQVKPDDMQTCRGISEEVILRLKEMNGLGQTRYDQAGYTTEKGKLAYSYGFDGEKFKYITLKMIHDAGVHILFHTMFADSIMEGNKIVGVIFENKSGRQATFGKVIIDATGDADVSYRAGVPYWKADQEKEKTLVNGLMYKVAGFKSKEIDAFDFKSRDFVRTKQTLVFWGPWSTAMDGVNADELTAGEIDARLRVYEEFKKKQKKYPFLKDAAIVETPPLLGIRQTRFIEGLYKITGDDAIAGTKFDDTIAMSPCPIINFYGYRRFLEHVGYEIPYRCLLPQKVDGLLVTGRCISTDQRAFESQRAMAPTMCIGEAAGTAAALSVQYTTTPKQLDAKKLQQQLMTQGAEIGQHKKG